MESTFTVSLFCESKIPYKLCERLFVFAVKTLKTLKTLGNTAEYRVIRYQLAKSATSAGANYEESQAASSRKDFKGKIDIALREMRESNYWLRIITELEPFNANTSDLLVESKELMAILGSIASKVKE
jgi:four helix bundle protein